MIHALALAGGYGATVPPSPAWASVRSACAELDPASLDPYPGTFNDTHEHAEVMDAFDRAIALAESGS